MRVRPARGILLRKGKRLSAEPDIRFAVDGMLIKLGKYLRILGYDAVWADAGRTHDLIHRANREGRIFCTRNTHIEDQFPRPRQWILVTSPDAVTQLRALIQACALDTRDFLFSRCIRCNVPLEPVPAKAEIRGQVHPNVYARYHDFFRCPSCGTIFWHGSHVQNTRRKLHLPTLGPP